MKIQDQLKGLNDRFETTNHKLVTAICDAVAKELENGAKIKMIQVGKKAKGYKIETTLTGQSSGAEINKDIEMRVKQTMDGLKNPTVLADLIK